MRKIRKDVCINEKCKLSSTKIFLQKDFLKKYWSVHLQENPFRKIYLSGIKVSPKKIDFGILPWCETDKQALSSGRITCCSKAS